jgi:hypothetical protein
VAVVCVCVWERERETERVSEEGEARRKSPLPRCGNDEACQEACDVIIGEWEGAWVGFEGQGGGSDV